MAEDRPRAWIVDTNLISRPTSGAPDLHTWLQANAPLIRISVVTIAEARRGLLLAQARIDRLDDPRVRRRDQAVLDAKVAWYGRLRRKFADRLLPIDADVAERWADISVRFPSIRDGDRAILATALARGYGVASRNLRDFRAAEIPLVDPFDRATW